MKRREFLAATTLTATSTLLGVHPMLAGAEPPPETTKLRLIRSTGMCWAPQYAAEELLRAEGFTDVSSIRVPRRTRCRPT
jgi:NitT/TauT family transport system substrate-binding protein